MLSVHVAGVDLQNLNFHVRDEVPATPFETTLTLANAQINDVSTRRDETGSGTLAIEFEEQASLDWQLDNQFSPPVFSGQLALTNFGLPTVGRYLQDTLPFSIDSGSLNASLAYRLDLSGESLELSLDEVELAVSDLAATQDGRQQPFISAALLSAGAGRVQVPENQVDIEELNLQHVELALTREAGGQTNIEQILAALMPSEVPDPSSQAEDQDPGDTDWFFSLQRLALEGNRVTLEDSSLTTAANLGVGIDLEIVDLDNQPDSLFPISAELTMDSGGELQLSGELGAIPAPRATIDASLTELDLSILQPYVSEYALVQVESALLDAQSELTLEDAGTFVYRGDVQLRDLSVADQRLEENLLGLEALTVDGIDFSSADNSLDVSEVVFDQLYARVHIDESGGTNVGQLVRQQVVADAEADVSEPGDTPAAAASSPVAVTVGRVRVVNAASNFTDLNLPIPFNANIRELSGSVEGFSAPSAQPLVLALEGSVDEFGLVQLDSSLDPFNITAQSQIDLEFRNLQVPPLTPYTIRFAGREIAEGTMDVDLSYRVDEGQLAASNQVVLNDLQLGERVEYPGAMELPLDLAMALLKDGRGVIDLEVPVSGDVNSPDFDLGPAIRRAITNVLTNIVAAPFRLLGALIGGEDDDISVIRFQAARSDLAPPERQVLQRLQEALAQRPELILEIPPLQSEADRVALQSSVVAERIEARLALLEADDRSLTERRLTVVETLYSEASLVPDTVEVRQQNNIETSVPNPLTGEPLVTTQLDVQAYFEDLRGRLVANEPVSDGQLSDLAIARATVVSEYLVTQDGLDAARVVIVEPQTVAPDEDGWLPMEFGLSSR